MKGAILLLEKDGVLVRTSFAKPNIVNWLNAEEVPLYALTQQGFICIEEDLVSKALRQLHSVRDSLCNGRKVTNDDLLNIIRILEEY